MVISGQRLCEADEKVNSRDPHFLISLIPREMPILFHQYGIPIQRTD